MKGKQMSICRIKYSMIPQGAGGKITVISRTAPPPKKKPKKTKTPSQCQCFPVVRDSTEACRSVDKMPTALLFGNRNEYAQPCSLDSENGSCHPCV